MVRHVPTALYIDTQVFVSNNLRFDTRAFNAIRDTFVKGGLRLLIPAMMERELQRKFRQEASIIAKDLSKVLERRSIRHLSLLETLSPGELEERCISQFQEKWGEFQEHFTIESLPMVGSLEDVVDWYIRVEAPFSEKKTKEFPDAFILSALEQYHKDKAVRIAVIGRDPDFTKFCSTRAFLVPFDNLVDYVEAFRPELSLNLEGEIIDPTRPIVTEDLSEIKAMLGRGPDVTETEQRRIIGLLSPRGSNYDYFFRHAKDALWVDPLVEEGFFANPPSTERFEDGRIRTPFWQPMDYLVRVFEQAPDKVTEVLKSLPYTDNPHILEGILEIIIKSDTPELIEEFYGHVEAFLEVASWNYERIIELLEKPYLFEGLLVDVSPALLLKIVEFRPDPDAEEKGQRKKDDPSDWSTSLNPAPRCESWRYQEILDRGVGPLATREPFAVARVLIDAVASMIRLSMHGDDGKKGSDEDMSEVWCRRLDHHERGFRDSKGALVHALTVACQTVYNRAPESIDALDQALRNQRWKVFKRIRQFLYAQNPTDQTLPWIREFILAHEDYGKWALHHELQLMIRKSCEHFGDRLITEEERSKIFDIIFSGPSQESFRESMGDLYTEELWIQRQHYFQRMQLRPFAKVLFADYRTTYEGLEREFEDDPLTDESYSLIGETLGGTVSYRSPYSIDNLSSLSDEELLTTINEWDESRRDSDDWLIEINIAALALAFGTVFTDAIVPDSARLEYWINNRELIQRPVYVMAMTVGMQEITKALEFENLDRWLEFCDWILDQANEALDEQDWGNDSSPDNPDWRSSRRAVGDFVGVCLSQEVNVPLSARNALAGLLRKLCVQFDFRLDQDRPVLLNRGSPVTEAINNTRSRALQDLIEFGYWVRRHDEGADLPEVREIFELRLADNALQPLTLPERALLGTNYLRIWGLDNDWTATNKARFFPQGDLPVWVHVFAALIRYSRPFLRTFELLRADFNFALDHLDDLNNIEDGGDEIIDTLGQHLFTYYLWDVYPLRGEDSPLNTFYDNTTNDRIRWGRLFDHVGRTVRNSGPKLDDVIKERIIAFFDWRFDQNEAVELQEFSFWLGAACLDPDWRLDAYSRVLDVSQSIDIGRSIELDALNELLEQHTGKVVECFAKITDHIDQGEPVYFPRDKGMSILRAGLKSQDETIRISAGRARENLLRAGRFEFLEIDEQ